MVGKDKNICFWSSGIISELFGGHKNPSLNLSYNNYKLMSLSKVTEKSLGLSFFIFKIDVIYLPSREVVNSK